MLLAPQHDSTTDFFVPLLVTMIRSQCLNVLMCSTFRSVLHCTSPYLPFTRFTSFTPISSLSLPIFLSTPFAVLHPILCQQQATFCWGLDNNARFTSVCRTHSNSHHRSKTNYVKITPFHLFYFLFFRSLFCLYLVNKIVN